MSCHNFDWGNEKYGEKLGTRLRWRNNWDDITLTISWILIYKKFANFEKILSWSSVGEVGLKADVGVNRRVGKVLLCVSLHRPLYALSLSLSLSLSGATVYSLNIEHLCILINKRQFLTRKNIGYIIVMAIRFINGWRWVFLIFELPAPRQLAPMNYPDSQKKFRIHSVIFCLWIFQIQRGLREDW